MAVCQLLCCVRANQPQPGKQEQEQEKQEEDDFNDAQVSCVHGSSIIFAVLSSHAGLLDAIKPAYD